MGSSANYGNIAKKITTVGQESINIYDSSLAVASGADSIIVSYTVPIGKVFYLKLVECDGDNIASYEVIVDSVTQAKKKTYFSGPLYGDFWFENVKIESTKVIELKVSNFRADVADFFGRIVGVLE